MVDLLSGVYRIKSLCGNDQHSVSASGMPNGKQEKYYKQVAPPKVQQLLHDHRWCCRNAHIDPVGPNKRLTVSSIVRVFLLWRWSH